MNRTDMKSSWLYRNLANIITMTGLKLCFALLWVVIFHREWTITIFYLVGGILLTDFLDGPIARWSQTVSNFGSGMDRLRDKFFQLTMFSFFFAGSKSGSFVKRSYLSTNNYRTVIVGSFIPWSEKKCERVCGNMGES